MKKLLYIILFVPFALFGQENYSLSFDGYSKISLNDMSLPSIFTLEVKVKVSSEANLNFSDAGAHIFSIGASSNTWATFALGISSYTDITEFTSIVVETDRYSQIPSNIEFPINQWVRIIVVFENTNLKIYQNGVLVLNQNLEYSPTEGPSNNVYIGSRGDYWQNDDYNFNGKIEYLSFYNRVFTLEEIQCEDNVENNNVIGYWSFNEGSGNYVYDSSGNANHGLIQGTTFSGDISEQNCIEGCTDSLAENYNPEAFLDNETCEYILGCTEPNAVNYNQLATQNDSTCISQEEYTIDSLNNVVEQATTSLSSLQQALDTWNTSIDLSAGWNMFGYGCPSSIDLAEGLSNHTASIIITKDNNGNVYMPEFGFNGIGDFTPGFGYQIKVTESIEGFSLCDWYVNDIPEDNIVSLQDSLEIVNSQIGCTDSFACNFDEIHLYEDGSCEYPDQGFDCNGDLMPYIGMEAFGGIVFYVQEGYLGKYGLVVYDSIFNQSSQYFNDQYNTYAWGCSNQEINGADNLTFGYGYQNTLDIKLDCNDEYSISNIISSSNLNNYNDWFIPSIGELSLVTDLINNNNEFSTLALLHNQNYPIWYWSSSEANVDHAWSVNINSGEQSDHMKNSQGGSHGLIPIRAFGNWTMGCMDLFACNYNSEANMADGSCTYAEQGYDCNGNITEYVVGMQAEGGIVFYVDETGQHGLVAAIEDLEGTYEWGCYEENIDGADGASIGTGFQNTFDIVSGCLEAPIAASASLAYESEDYSDWYLPSRNELAKIYNTIGNGGLDGNIGNFEDNWYWSSTQNGSTSAFIEYFDVGHTVSNGKHGSGRVRPIRSF